MLPRNQALNARPDRTAAGWRLQAAILALLMVLSSLANAAPSSDAVVEQPRTFGYFLGDRLQQRVLLEQQGETFQPITWPGPERLGAWIVRLGSHTDADSAGRTWLTVDYQILNASPGLSTVRLPAWELKGSIAEGGRAGKLSIPSWVIYVAALTPSGNPEADTLRPDRSAPLIPTQALARRLQLSLAFLALTLLSWLAWLLWRNRRTAVQQPFAQAWRQIRGLGETDTAAWHAIHRAFDRSANFAVQTSSLDRLFREAPQLEAARPEIEAFFKRSDALFFASGATPEPIDLRALCNKLRRLEIRQER